MENRKEHFALDLDGTILEYNGWKDEDTFGKPFVGVTKWIKNRLEEGHRVTVFTARENTNKVKSYLDSIGFPDIPVTNVKQGSFTIMIDDRAFRFTNPHFWIQTKKNFAFPNPWWEDEKE